MNHHAFGTFYRFTLFGGSHEPLVGVEIEGIPAGSFLDQAALEQFLKRRSPSEDPYTTSRREKDIPVWEEGLVDGRFTGGTARAILQNRDIKAGDYEAIRHIPRPGHADWPAYVKYGEIPPGGGHFSGRMTAPLCIAGGVAKQLLEREGITISARILAIGGIPVEKAEAVETALAEAKAQGNSLGGLIRCEVRGLPAGLGDHPFEGLENRIAQAVFAIPAVKGLEFGDGFALAAMKGSEANDGYRLEKGQVVLKSNHAGGILGGMANGAPLIFRVAFKPTPSIAQRQDSVDLAKMENISFSIPGRHDVCIVLRAAPVVEAAAAAALYDALLEKRAMESPDDIGALRQRIDAADRQIAEAFRCRMEAVDLIGKYKEALGSGIYDSSREAEVLEKVLKRGGPELEAVYKTIFHISKERQGQERAAASNNT